MGHRGITTRGGVVGLLGLVLALAFGVSSAYAAWGNVFNLSGAGQDVGTAQVASDVEGDAVAVWERLDATENIRVQMRTISATGSLGPVVTLSAEGRSSFSGPHGVASDANGDSIVIYQEGPTNRIRARQISATGTVGPPITVASALGSVGDPMVATDADGDSIASWVQVINGSLRVRARTISDTGALGAVKTLSGAGSAVPDGIATDATGDSIVVWLREVGGVDRVESRNISAAGVLGPVRTLSPAGASASDPEVATDADGDSVATWNRPDGADDRVQVRTISPASVLGPLKTLSQAGVSGTDAQVASNSAGGAIVSWTSDNGSTQVIKARTLSAAGPLGSIKNVSVGASSDIATDADGDAMIVWSRVTGFGATIEARTMSPAGVLGTADTISNFTEVALDPEVASDADGDTVSVWGIPQRVQGVQNR